MLKFGLLALAILAGSCRRNFPCWVLSSSSQSFPQVTIFLLHNSIVYSSPVVKLLSQPPLPMPPRQLGRSLSPLRPMALVRLTAALCTTTTIHIIFLRLNIPFIPCTAHLLQVWTQPECPCEHLKRAIGFERNSLKTSTSRTSTTKSDSISISVSNYTINFLSSFADRY